MNKSINRTGIAAVIGLGLIASVGAAQAALTGPQVTALQTAMKSNNKITIDTAINNLITTQHASPTDVAMSAAQFAVAGTISPALTTLELSYVTAQVTADAPTQAATLVQTITQTVVASPLFKSNPTTLSSMITSSVNAAIGASPSQGPAIAQSVALGLVTAAGFSNAATTAADKTILDSVVTTASAANPTQAAQIVQNVSQVIVSTGALGNPSAVDNATSTITGLLSAAIVASPTQAATIAFDVAQKINLSGSTAVNITDIDSAIGTAAATAAATRGQPVSVTAQIAANLASLSPTGAAQIFLSTFLGLPASQQTTANATLLAIAIDKAVPNANVTASETNLLAQLKNPTFYTNNPATRIILTAQLTTALNLLKTEESVSPH
jgi:hypothetical protein